MVPFLEKRPHFPALLLCDRDILLPRGAKEWLPRTTQYPLEGDQLCPVALGSGEAPASCVVSDKSFTHSELRGKNCNACSE